MNFERFSALFLILFIQNGSPARADESAMALPSAGLSSSAPASTASSLSETELKQMGFRFKQALKGERVALVHRQRKEAESLKAAHRTQEREWKASEKVARKAFFESEADGKKRREWMQDRQRRFTELKASFKAARAQQEQEHQQILEKLEADHLSRQKRFDESLVRKEVPSESVWSSSIL